MPMQDHCKPHLHTSPISLYTNNLQPSRIGHTSKHLTIKDAKASIPLSGFSSRLQPQDSLHSPVHF